MEGVRMWDLVESGNVLRTFDGCTFNTGEDAAISHHLLVIFTG
jgi:hypothetical protein